MRAVSSRTAMMATSVPAYLVVLTIPDVGGVVSDMIACKITAV